MASNNEEFRFECTSCRAILGIPVKIKSFECPACHQEHNLSGQAPPATSTSRPKAEEERQPVHEPVNNHAQPEPVQRPPPNYAHEQQPPRDAQRYAPAKDLPGGSVKHNCDLAHILLNGLDSEPAAPGLSSKERIEVIRLNIGGHLYQATRNTLLKSGKGTLLYDLFCTNHYEQYLSNDWYFIDRNGAVFGDILTFLRDGKVACAPSKYRQLLHEAKHYKLRALESKLEGLIAESRGNEEISPDEVQALRDTVKEQRIQIQDLHRDNAKKEEFYDYMKAIADFLCIAPVAGKHKAGNR